MTGPKELIDKLHKNQELSLEEWTELIKNRTPELSEYLFELAREERHKYYGHDVYVRGLIEFTNYCRNDCLYCGIRKVMQQHTGIVWTRIPFFAAARKAMIWAFAPSCCKAGGWLLHQGAMVHLIERIRSMYSDFAITLSIGEKSREDYQAFYEAGANRYLLRHETFNANHYSSCIRRP